MPIPLIFRCKLIRGPVERLNKTQMAALAQFRNKLDHGYYDFEAVTCLCGASEGVLVATIDRYLLPVKTYLCRQCGIMWTNPRMTEPSLHKFYSEDYRLIYGGNEMASDDFFRDQVLRGNEIHKFVVSASPPFRLRVVFDVGCGAGGVLAPFARSGSNVCGCDIGSKYLERGRKEGFTLVAGDASSLASQAPASLIILSHVLEHMLDPVTELKTLHNLLEHDGLLHVELPGIMNIQNVYGDTLLFLQNAHLYHFTLETLCALLAPCGFKLVKGNQYIQAVFQRTQPFSYSPPAGTATQIRNHLLWLEFDRLVSLRRLYGRCRHGLSKLARGTIGDHRVNRIRSYIFGKS